MIGWVQKALADKHDPIVVPASLFSQNEPFGVGGIPFDLLTGESHGLDFDISEHPIEDGSVVSDHVRRKLRQCTVTGMFSIHHLPVKYSDKEVDISKREAIVANRARDLINDLETLASKMQPVRLVTSMHVYPKMMITSIKHDRKPEDGEATKFTMTLREISVAAVKQVVMDAVIAPPDMSTGQNRRAGANVNNGLTSAENKLSSDIAGLKDGEPKP